MAFSSNFFLFAFLPIFFAAYYLAPKLSRNALLLVVSLIFYAFDAGYMIWLLLASIVVNHVAAKAIAATQGAVRKVAFIGAVIANLAPLLYFKYAMFLWGAADSILVPIGSALGPAPSIILPIGISFYTFQAISYVADVYTGHVAPASRIVDFGAYHCLFPQLIAGPIVRYVEIERSLYDRPLSVDQAADGCFRFCIGLGKKIILADNFGAIVDPIFRLPGNELTAPIAWLGIIAYSLQIYFDFSGYSDMAIGLGKMLGFDFPENFNCPYRARSVTEFWRRWHMTLTRWFRDYVYIQLGGNRAGPRRTYFNLTIVFLLCGLWHGAGYTFIVWGLWHGVILVAERVAGIGQKKRGTFAWFVTLLLVAVGWVFFRATDLHQAIHFLEAMFGLSQPGTVYYGPFYFLTWQKAFFLACGLLFALGPFETVSFRLSDRAWRFGMQSATAAVIFVYSVALLSANSFNPFIYFRF